MGISEDREECLPSPPPPQCQHPGQELSIAAEWIFTLEPGDSSPGDLEIPTALEILLALICAPSGFCYHRPRWGRRTCVSSLRQSPRAATFQIS